SSSGGELVVDAASNQRQIQQPQHRHRGGILVANTSERQERENSRRQIAISGGHRKGSRQLRRDKPRHQEHQTVDAQTCVKKKWRERALERAILDARPDVPVRNEAEDEERHSVTDEKVDVIG